MAYNKVLITGLRNVEITRSPLGYDAWQKPKTITDYSLFNTMWTFLYLIEGCKRYKNVAGTSLEFAEEL